VIYITHDLGTVAKLAHDICVIYGGRVVETGAVQSVLGNPRHPYTRMLLDSRPDPFKHRRGQKLAPAQANRADASKLPPENPLCNFRLRCAFATDRCGNAPAPLKGPVDHRDACLRADEIDLGFSTGAEIAEVAAMRTGGGVLLKLQDLRIRYGRNSLVSRLLGMPSNEFEAVRGIDIEIGVGKTLGLVGESGCGKSTLARALVGLSRFNGTIAYGDKAMSASEDMDRAYRQSVQLIFQNADLALNPRLSVGELISRPLLLYGLAKRSEARRKVAELLERVKLPASYAERYTSQLSGGEKQRVSIARAFAASPRLIICDEITSSLDVSVQAAILDLLTELQRDFGTSYVFISHDLNVVQSIADEVAVMYLGRLIERRKMSTAMIQPPFHPYTEALLSAVPVADPSVLTRQVQADGALPNPRTPPKGCAFATRCPRKLGAVCDDVPPPRQQVGGELEILCHIPIDDLAKVPPLWSRAEIGPSV
jgi:peptide/nickel transport system ATP-binding protein